uniref:Uncharacterized protein n=1 Tax=Chlamydomonas euryale TaxID=1486919 RepID=A0A7R9YUZ5_9CHLO
MEGASLDGCVGVSKQQMDIRQYSEGMAEAGLPGEACWCFLKGLESLVNLIDVFSWGWLVEKALAVKVQSWREQQCQCRRLLQGHCRWRWMRNV